MQRVSSRRSYAEEMGARSSLWTTERPAMPILQSKLVFVVLRWINVLLRCTFNEPKAVIISSACAAKLNSAINVAIDFVISNSSVCSIESPAKRQLSRSFSRGSLQRIECSRLQVSILSGSSGQTAIDSWLNTWWQNLSRSRRSLFCCRCGHSVRYHRTTGVLLCDACSTHQSNTTILMSRQSLLFRCRQNDDVDNMRH